jgi:hypothetical protein
MICATAGRVASRAAASAPPIQQFEVDRLLASTTRSNVFIRKYVASATVTIFSFPLISRSGVGGGYTVIEEGASDRGNAISIQFGAGSWPEKARGLNRLGFIQEAIVEQQAGKAAECAYLAFMTSSTENNLDQAKKALETSANIALYNAAQGYSGRGRVTSRVDRMHVPSRFTWWDAPSLIARARSEMAGRTEAQNQLSLPAGEREMPGMFLYTLRGALLNTEKRTRGELFFNSKLFLLETEKEEDSSAGKVFVEKKLATSATSVIRLAAVLTERRTREKTRFRLWYEKGGENTPPLRFDYQAKSFLRLTFQADPDAAIPPIRLAFADPKENA